MKWLLVGEKLEEYSGWGKVSYPKSVSFSSVIMATCSKKLSMGQNGSQWVRDQENMVDGAKSHIPSRWVSLVSSRQHVAEHCLWVKMAVSGWEIRWIWWMGQSLISQVSFCSVILVTCGWALSWSKIMTKLEKLNASLLFSCSWFRTYNLQNQILKEVIEN